MLSAVCLTGAEESVTSLVDIISPKEHIRLTKALEAAQPYDDARTAYLIVQALRSLGFSDANKQVSVHVVKIVDPTSKIHTVVALSFFCL